MEASFGERKSPFSLRSASLHIFGLLPNQRWGRSLYHC